MRQKVYSKTRNVKPGEQDSPDMQSRMDMCWVGVPASEDGGWRTWGWVLSPRTRQTRTRSLDTIKCTFGHLFMIIRETLFSMNRRYEQAKTISYKYSLNLRVLAVNDGQSLTFNKQLGKIQ